MVWHDMTQRLDLGMQQASNTHSPRNCPALAAALPCKVKTCTSQGVQCCPPLPLSLLPLQAISDNSDKLVAHADADERAALAGYTGGKCDKPTVVAAGCEQPAKVGKNYAVQVGAGPQGGPYGGIASGSQGRRRCRNRAGLTGMVCCDVAFLSTGGSLRCRQTLLPCTTMGPMQVNVTCGDTTIGYVALVATDGASYWNVRCF